MQDQSILNDVQTETKISQSIQRHFFQIFGDLYGNIPVERVVADYIEGKFIEEISIKNALEVLTTEFQVFITDSYRTPWMLIDQWRKLLSLLLIAKDENHFAITKELFVRQMVLLSECVLWNEFQLLSMYQVLVAHLLDYPSVVLPPFQLLNGSAPLEHGEHWEWGKTPHPLFHAELGILWSIYYTITGDPLYKQATITLSKWQLNTLNHDYAPCIGLFSHEGDLNETKLLMRNALLFKTVSLVNDHKEMTFYAEKQLELLGVKECEELLYLPLDIVTLDKWLSKRYQNRNSLPFDSWFSLNTQIKDESLSLIGCRSSKETAIATLSGGGSGLGCFYHGDVQIVSFGPQHSPLGDCLGYGIDGIVDSTRTSTLFNSSSKEFQIKGISTLRAVPPDDEDSFELKTKSPLTTFRQGYTSGVWFNTEINYEQGFLSVTITPQEIFQLDLAFSFFVKATECVINGNESIKTRSLQHYWGKAAHVEIKGKQKKIILNACQEGEMHVIPLGGGENFWGADFLISYVLNSESNICSQLSQKKSYSFVVRVLA